MQDPLSVCVPDGPANKGKHPHPRLERVPIAVAPLIEWNAVDEFHHQVRRAIGGVSGIKDVRDVGMLELCERELLGFEPPECGRAHGSDAQDLDRDGSHDRLELLAAPDHAERPFADHSVQADTADARRRGRRPLVHASEEKIRREVLLAWLHTQGDCTRAPPASKRTLLGVVKNNSEQPLQMVHRVAGPASVNSACSGRRRHRTGGLGRAESIEAKRLMRDGQRALRMLLAQDA